MAWNSPRTWTTGEVVTKALLDEQIRDNEIFLKTNIALEVAVELTIASGVITKTQSHHKIKSETSTADDLVTINGGADGDELIIRASAGHVITLKHGTGNIYCESETDLALTAITYAVLRHNGTNWIISNSGSGGGIAKGTEFPVTALKGDGLYRTDEGKLYFCNEDY